MSWAKTQIPQTKTKKLLSDTSKEVGLEVNTEKTKYMLMFRDQIAGQNYNSMMDNESFKNVYSMQFFLLFFMDSLYFPQWIRYKKALVA
jgi:hypothetical protein